MPWKTTGNQGVFGQNTATTSPLRRPAGVQVGRDPVDVGGELTVGDHVALEAVDQRGGVRPVPAGGQDELGNGDVRDLDIGVRAGQGHGGPPRF